MQVGVTQVGVTEEGITQVGITQRVEILDGMPVHRRVTPSIKFAGTHLYIWVERGTVEVEVSCPRTQHNVHGQAQTLTARSGDERTNHEAIAPPTRNIIQ